jgi:hypothetical protein
VTAQQDPLQASTKTVNVELILDASGSMAEVLPDGETRMAAAKRILRGVIEGLPERAGVNVGLRVYGHLGDNTETGKPVSCRSSELLVPIAGVDKPLLTQTVEAMQPTGWTPIAYSLEQAAANFQPGGESVTNAIVLVTDGEETCDPPQQSCDAASALRQAGIAVTTHVVGFALTPQQTEQVSCIAEQGGGQLFGAGNAGELSTALGEALEGVGVSITPVAIPPAPSAVPLAEIRTLAYHQLTGWQTPLFERGIEVGGETAPILSDDGQRIAFGNHPGEGAADPRNRIFVINANGTGEREVDAYPFLCFCASMIDLSADGSRVVSSDAVQLRVADDNGAGGRALIALASNEINGVRISGDGSRIVFRIYRDTSIRDTAPAQPIERGIYVINADGSGLRQIVAPSQLAALLGVSVEQAPFFGGSWGLDVSRDGSRVVFVSYAEIDPGTGSPREALFAVNGDGAGLRRLLGPTVTYVINGAISGDGSTVAYITGNAADGRQEAGVIGIDGGGQRTLTDNTTGYPGLGGLFSLPTGERIQLSSDGTRLLLGSTGLLYDATNGDRLTLGASTVSVSGDPTPLVIDGLYRPTMNAQATRFAYVFQPFGEPYQVARLDLNPGDLGGAPSVAEASVTPPFVLTETRSTATISARVSTPNAFLRVGSRVLFRGLPDPNVDTWYYGPMADDGATVGDAVAGDDVFTYDGIATNCCAEVGPRIIRVKAETQTTDGLRHATAVDVVPFAVVANAGDVPTVVPVTTAVTPPGECRWTGTWSTTFGTMRLTQNDPVEGVITVSGDYDHDQGQIQGTLSGPVLSGTWTEAPSRQPPSDAGHIEFTLAEDCQSFTGQWRYGFSGDWQPGWDGQAPEMDWPTSVPPILEPPTSTPIPEPPTAIPPSPITPVPPTPATPTPTPTPLTSPSSTPDTAIASNAIPPGMIVPLPPRTGPAASPAATTPEAVPDAQIDPNADVTQVPVTEEAITETGIDTGAQTPTVADFITPDPAECTVTPRTADELAALSAAPDQAAIDALAAAWNDAILTVPDGLPADAATTAAVVETYRLIIACNNAGNQLAGYALWTDDALRQVQAALPAGAPTPVPAEGRAAFRVREARILPDGQVVASWEYRDPLVSASWVQVLVRQGDRYLIDATLDLLFE